MNLRSLMGSLAVVVVCLGLCVAALFCCYNVSEQELVILTQFGKTLGEPVREAGLHYRVPFVQSVNRLDKRILEWDGRVTEMPTRDKLYIIVDAFGRWRITDPMQYFTRLRDERSALSRLDDIIGSEVRNAVAKHDLIEIVRTDKKRQPLVDTNLNPDAVQEAVLPPITLGRTALEREVVDKAAPKLKDFGVELIDVRFMRINYNSRVSTKIHERMVSERQQIASRFRSEGEGEAAKIQGNKERELRRIESEAFRDAQKLRGAADARATEIYASAYNQSPAAAEFYRFVGTMETWQKTLTNDTTLILSTDSELYRYFKKAGGQPH